LYVDAETITDASPPIVAANMSRTPNMMQTQFVIHERLKGLGLTIHNHIIHGKKYVVGAKANPPKNPSKAEKNGKVIPANSVKTAKVCNPLNNPKIKNKLVKENFVLQKSKLQYIVRI
jgi:hypothetical protein